MDTKELEAGRVLDAEVHQKIFGATPLDCFEGVYPENRTNPYPGTDADWIKDSLPHYSTDIAAAWLVVEKIKQSDLAIAIDWDGFNWACEIDGDYRDFPSVDEIANTAPLAICRATLKVKAD